MSADTTLTVHGKRLPSGAESFGELRSSAVVQDDFKELRRRIEEDGYLYLPGLLDRDTLLAARRTMLEALAEQDFLDLDFPLNDGVAKREISVSAREMVGLSRDNDALQQALFSGPMISFYEKFLGGSVRPPRFYLVPRQVVRYGNGHQPPL